MKKKKKTKAAVEECVSDAMPAFVREANGQIMSGAKFKTTCAAIASIGHGQYLN